MSQAYKIFAQSVMLVGLTFFATAQAATTTIRIRVFNRSQIPRSILLQAERSAFEILHRAGIEAVWLNCEGGIPACVESTSTTSLIITILKRGSAMAGEDMLGLAVQDNNGNGGYCYVFEDKLDEIAGQLHINTFQLLGAAFAHEIGHQLKGSHSHSPTGIMSARWSPHELEEVARGALWFTTQDSVAMQARLEQINRLRDNRSPDVELQAKR